MTYQILCNHNNSTTACATLPTLAAAKKLLTEIKKMWMKDSPRSFASRTGASVVICHITPTLEADVHFYTIVKSN